MRPILRSLVVAIAFGIAGTEAAVAGGLVYSSRVLPNRANQEVAGFPASGVDWAIERGSVRIFGLRGDRFLFALRLRKLIIPRMTGPVCPPGTDPCFGFNPSPDVLARVVCHDAAGTAAVAATTKAVAMDADGNAFLLDVIALPDACFAPLVLIGGSRGPPPGFEEPSNWFAITGF